MMVPPLSERPVTEEDEEQFRRETAPRKYTLRQRWADYRAEVKARRPKGARARARAWLHVEPFYWGMRVTYVVLFAGAVFAVYINGVAEGWWPAWGERPTVAATTTPPVNPVPTPSPSATGEAAMSGGYQIGPDGVLVRPAEHAASTYTKPELPEEAKEHTERGAELAAEYVIDTITYAWNTGDTRPFEDITEPGKEVRETYIHNVNELYSHGWMYDSSSTVTKILRVAPVDTEEYPEVEPDTILVIFDIESSNGTACIDQRIFVSEGTYPSRIFLHMTWKNGRWIDTGTGVTHDTES